jgi:phospholipase C
MTASIGCHAETSATNVANQEVTASSTPTAADKIKHVVIIMQENRSFDHYFGMFPGLPMGRGIPPGTCIKDPDEPPPSCIAPFHDPNDVNAGGPHSWNDSLADVDNGKMDGFVVQQEMGRHCKPPDPHCVKGGMVHDVMGYKLRADIPNYWAYADNFVLQDQMYEPVASWSKPSHLYLVSEWSATCPTMDPMSCVNDPQQSKTPFAYSWTDLTYLLHKNGISWKYYVDDGTAPDCDDQDDPGCVPPVQTATKTGIWNPLPAFVTVKEDGELWRIQSIAKFFEDANGGKLPAVSWIIPSGVHSEHPPNKVSVGQAYVTGLINAVMMSSDWDSTAIFVTWDDWGGFYDHMVPPAADQNGYGIRVPGLVISPYAKKGYIDDQVLSFDAYVRFIENVFIGGQELDPKTDGRPDPRPDVREDSPILGHLVEDFDFTQAPRPPLILSDSDSP